MTAAAFTAAVAFWPLESFARDTRLQRLLHDDRATVLVVSHRACWKKAPENSLAGIEACIADGIDMVEIDVRTTRDGALVVMHDETVDRTTDGTGNVSDLSLAEVRSLKLRAYGGGAAAALTGQNVPTFDETLVAVRGRVLMNIDVKAAALGQIIDAVVAADSARDVVMNVPVDCDPAIVARARKLGIAIQPVYLERQSQVPPKTAIRRAKAMRPLAIQIIFDDPAILGPVRHAAGKARLFVNTMAFDIESGRPMNLSGPFLDTRALDDPDAIWGALVKSGVTLIQTDEPWRLRDWLRAKQLR